MPILDEPLPPEEGDEQPSNIVELHAAPHEQQRNILPLQRRMGEVLLYLDRLARGVIRPTGSPWEGLDTALDGGWWPESYILVGKPGAGKTQLMIQAMLQAVRNGCVGCYVSLEIPQRQIDTRLLGVAAGVKWSDLYRGRDHQALQEARNVSAELSSLPLYTALVPPDGWHYKRLPMIVSELERTHPGRRMFIVVDFLQIISGDPRADLRATVGKAAYQAKYVTEHSDVCCVVLSSTARENYAKVDEGERQTKAQRELSTIGEGDSRWLVGTGKESGEIEYSADNVLVLANDGARRPWLAVAKVRAGRSGAWVPLDFDGGRFVDRQGP